MYAKAISDSGRMRKGFEDLTNQITSLEGELATTKQSIESIKADLQAVLKLLHA